MSPEQIIRKERNLKKIKDAYYKNGKQPMVESVLRRERKAPRVLPEGESSDVTDMLLSQVNAVDANRVKAGGDDLAEKTKEFLELAAKGELGQDDETFRFDFDNSGELL